MTCDEFRRQMTKNPDESTAAELSAWIVHGESCGECLDLLIKAGSTIVREATAADRRVAKAICERSWKRVQWDPEARL